MDGLTIGSNTQARTLSGSRLRTSCRPAIYLGGLLVSIILSAAFTWLLFVIYFAGLVVSSLMVGIKRLHDPHQRRLVAIFFFIVPIALHGRMNGWSLGGQLGETARHHFPFCRHCDFNLGSH